MPSVTTLDRSAATAKQHNVKQCAGLGVLFAALAAAFAAHAADGCTVLLCLAAPSWRAIPQCVPPVQKALRDVARGRPFPSCPSSGAGNTASHQWASAPDNCPPQYSRRFEGPIGPGYRCDYVGAVTVEVGGALWARTWWSMEGASTVTEYAPAAKTQLGTWDTRFDDDYAAWLVVQQQCLTC